MTEERNYPWYRYQMKNGQIEDVVLIYTMDLENSEEVDKHSLDGVNGVEAIPIKDCEKLGIELNFDNCRSTYTLEWLSPEDRNIDNGQLIRIDYLTSMYNRQRKDEQWGTEADFKFEETGDACVYFK